MPKAVSDSSTLIHSAGIGRLNLLMEIYKKILIPPTVWVEMDKGLLKRRPRVGIPNPTDPMLPTP